MGLTHWLKTVGRGMASEVEKADKGLDKFVHSSAGRFLFPAQASAKDALVDLASGRPENMWGDFKKSVGETVHSDVSLVAGAFKKGAETAKDAVGWGLDSLLPKGWSSAVQDLAMVIALLSGPFLWMIL